MGKGAPDFVYEGDPSTIGTRWETHVKLFKISLVADNVTDETRKKAMFLRSMGEEAFKVYETLCKECEIDTLDEVYDFMKGHIVAKRSEFSEIIIFRRTMRHPSERVGAYAVRLQGLTRHCKFSNPEKEVLTQLIASCNMDEFQRAACKLDNLNLKSALELAEGYERVEQSFNTLLSGSVTGATCSSSNHIVAYAASGSRSSA
jgi:hypothetical protein